MVSPRSAVTSLETPPLGELGEIGGRSPNGPVGIVRRARTGDAHELPLEAVWVGLQDGWLEPTDTITVDGAAEVPLGSVDLVRLALETRVVNAQTLVRPVARANDISHTKLLIWVVVGAPVLLLLWTAWGLLSAPGPSTVGTSNPGTLTKPPRPGQVVTNPAPTRRASPVWPLNAAGEPVVAETSIVCTIVAKVDAEGIVRGIMKPPEYHGCIDPFLTAAARATNGWVFEPGTRDGVASDGVYPTTFRFEPDGSVEIVPTP